MIPRIPGWTWLARDGGVTLVHPDGPAAGCIRYRERLRPLHRVLSIIRAQDNDPSFELVDLRQPQQIVTAEGEFGAFVRIDGLLQGRPARRAVAFIYGDDFYSHIAGLALQPERFDALEAVVRHLADQEMLGLGERRRRFLHAPPRGWQALERVALHAYYFPPDYPRNRSVLVVYPALPDRGWREPDLLSILLPIDGPAVTQVRARRAANNGRMAGELWSCLCSGLEGQTARDVLVLRKGRYLYPMSLDSPPERHRHNREVLLQVAQSVVALPQPRPLQSLQVTGGVGAPR
ncbi:MAG: hypothetical protein RMK29_19845 [Myxococcales bacterium]|nr:hypothetical protein [Myxococcota bacterium]MDW8283962.1 hypothetical protein [Myxococcales bacterium]